MTNHLSHTPGASDAVVLRSASAWPGSVVVVGCGLIGSSLAHALMKTRPQTAIIGIESNESHRELLSRDVFRSVYGQLSDLPSSSRFDLMVLATPLDTACEMLRASVGLADVVMDVCSAKVPICDVAVSAGVSDCFVPTHPMAGLATPGPLHADPDLFMGNPWLFLDGWTENDRIVDLVTDFGAAVHIMSSAQEHDSAMAAVSHGIHLTSLAAMLAFDEAAVTSTWRQITGPGFKDVTRLAGSPSDFWVDVLTANASHVREHLTRLCKQLEEFDELLESGEREALRARLDAAREARCRWQNARDKAPL